MREGVEQGHLERVRDAAHTLYSGSVTLGATGIASNCQRLEALDDDALEAARDLLGGIETEFEHMLPSVEPVQEASG